jgi:SPP1 family phage portal protein
LQARRHVIGRDPETQEAILMESKVLSNNKLNHNFMKKLTRQKIGYMLSKPFTLTAKNAKDEVAQSMFKQISKDYFGEDFLKMIKNVGRDSIVKGIGWILIYYNETGALKYRRIAPEEVIPIWADNDHTVLDAVIRKYIIKKFDRGREISVTYVDYYTRQGIYNYYYNDTGKLTTLNNGDPVAHFNRKIKGEDGVETVEGVNWANIPFIPFKYDPDEQSLIVRIKNLVDDYDKKATGVANNIDDFPNSMLVIKNYDGQSKEEFVHNKNQYRSIFVQGDGDAKSLETPLNITEVDVHLKRLREDIYEFGQGVNTADKDIRDTSGVALRFMYADLDMDCLDWGSEFKWSLKRLIWFIQNDIIAKGGDDYSSVEYDVVFNTDVIVNETETIQNCFTSKGVISDKTIAANHPWTLDADSEVEDMLGSMEEELKLEKQYGTKTTSSTTGQRTAATT